MGSPLGGFYLAAQQRVKAAQQAERDKIVIEVSLKLDYQQQVLFEQQLNIVVGKVLEVSNEKLDLTVSAQLESDDLCVFDVQVNSREYDISEISQQLCLTSGESVTSCFADNEGMRLQLLRHRKN